MAYGAYLSTDDGVEFFTTETTSIALDQKLTASGSGQFITVNATVKTEDIILPFCVTTGGPAFFEYSITGNDVTISARQTVGQYKNIGLEVYLFTTKAQIPPSWGMAIWDANGKCILTNETKILTDIRQIGVPGGVLITALISIIRYPVNMQSFLRLRGIGLRSHRPGHYKRL